MDTRDQEKFMEIIVDETGLTQGKAKFTSLRSAGCEQEDLDDINERIRKEIGVDISDVFLLDTVVQRLIGMF